MMERAGLSSKLILFVDHAMVACYLELYEEGEVDHINGPILPNTILVGNLAVKKANVVEVQSPYTDQMWSCELIM